MRSEFYQCFVDAWAAGAVNPTADPLFCLLLNGLYVFDSTHQTVADLAEFEVMGGGYIQGGRQIPEVRAVGSAIMAGPVVWPDSTITAVSCAASRAGGMLVGWFEFLERRSTAGEDFIVKWQDGQLFVVQARAN